MTPWNEHHPVVDQNHIVAEGAFDALDGGFGRREETGVGLDKGGSVEGVKGEDKVLVWYAGDGKHPGSDLCTRTP